MLCLFQPIHALVLTLSQDALVAKVASVNSRTIVVVNSVGPINMESWINHANGQWWLYINAESHNSSV